MSSVAGCIVRYEAHIALVPYNLTQSKKERITDVCMWFQTTRFAPSYEYICMLSICCVPRCHVAFALSTLHTVSPLLTDENPPVTTRLFLLCGWLNQWLLAWACHSLKQVCPRTSEVGTCALPFYWWMAKWCWSKKDRTSIGLETTIRTWMVLSQPRCPYGLDSLK